MYLHIVPNLFHLMANKCSLESIAIPDSAYDGVSPAKNQPRMESFLSNPGKRDSHDTWRVFDWGDFLEIREESLLLHTIQSERLNTDFSLFSRLPSLEQAIII
ncbi:hypothetical protein DQJ78_24080 [Salmonella enterica subsp. enterica serovar Newport]|nr:hypothetical protein [Salmonella enterica subsp. enterica serovar Newport]EBS2367458.1 hypothetical protein [Salmonella enterica subsp. enterica serovar Newport]EBS4398829.1 hypothetical protein [Salmonella enterica subsp. enterica serovar Newport]EBY9582871.1 hypothetical protein [Salmonella enterica subsp. enterica serovar Newport]